MKEPNYLTLARNYIGLKEISGQNDHPLLSKWWQGFGLGWLMSKPWCGLFPAECLRLSGVEPPKAFYRAKSWLNYGYKLDAPCLGCIVVFERKGGGHVGFVVAKDHAGRLLVLGGNQANAVSIAPFDMNRVLGYRMPFGYATATLPTLSNLKPASRNEA